MIKIRDLKKLGFEKREISEDEFLYALDMDTELEGLGQISLITNQLTAYDTKANVYSWERSFEEIPLTKLEIKRLKIYVNRIALLEKQINKILDKEK